MTTRSIPSASPGSALTSHHRLEGIIPVNRQLPSPPVGPHDAVAVLDIEPLDTSGHLLRLCCGPTAHVAVVSRRLSLPGAELRIDILSASHRVIVAGLTAADDVNETVACGGGGVGLVDGPLPAHHQWDTSNWSVDFSSELRIGDAAVVAAAAEVDSVSAQPTALVARFPGHPMALTALWVDDNAESPSWRSWHLYPGSPTSDSHVVTTTTRLEKKARS